MDGSDNVSSPGHEVSDAAARQVHLAACLDQVRQVAHADRRQDLESTIDSELQHLQRQDSLTVVVAAEVSRGKSLLVNALVGAEDLLPVDLDTTTGVHVVVRYEDPSAARMYKRNTTTPIADETDRIAEWISVARNPDNAKAVAYVDVGVPSALLAEGIKVINGHRLAMTPLWQLDKGCQDQTAALKGDMTPVQALQEKQKELAEHKTAADGWKQVAARASAEVGIKINRQLQDA